MADLNKQTAAIGSGRRGPGRPPGSPNKTTALLKEAILLAAAQHGVDGVGTDGLSGYCRHLAASEPRAFASLLGRIVPTQTTVEGRFDLGTVSKAQRDAAVSAALRADS